ncbi:MAG: DUF4870 domain-containing protein [Bryobacterales bacterium]|nr:DUF4870 domain-containing protein [Bryobacterales bacterium]
MPYCSQCGNQVRDLDAYCTKCGVRQPVAAPGGFPSATEAISDKASCVLCYIPFVGWVASIIVLASARFRENRIVRFHAFQALYLFVTWLVVDRVVGPILTVVLFRPLSHGGFWVPGLGIAGLVHTLELAIVVIGIVMMFRVSEKEATRLPWLGDLAEKSL